MAINRTKKQRNQEMRALGIRLLTLVILGFVSIAFLYVYNFMTTTTKLAIKNIRIDGITRTSTEDIERLLHDLEGQNIFQAPLETYGNRLRMIPRVKEASLKMVFPSTVACSVVEREPVALVFSKRFVEVDEEGMVLNGDAMSSKLDLPIITGVSDDALKEGHICTDLYLRNALEALRICKTGGGSFIDNISEIKTGKNGVSIVSLQDGCVVVLGDVDFGKRLKKFFLLRHTIEKNEITTRVIDLRFDDQIVLRSAF